MEPRSCDAVIVCPTLDIEGGAKTLADARKAAGMDCGLILFSDYARRGAVVIGNLMLRAAQDWGARWVCYMNDDVSAFQQGWLARLVEVVESDPRIGVAVPGSRCKTKPQCDGKPGLPPAILDIPCPAAWVCAVVKADVLKAVGQFDEGLRHYADDTDFELRMRAQGWKSVYVQDVYVEHRQDGWIDEWYKEDKRYLSRKWAHP